MLLLAPQWLVAQDRPVAESAAASLDHPLTELRTLDDYFPLEVPSSLEGWERRRSEVRRNLQVALGLWPLPTRTPLEPVIHGRREMEGFTIEKVYFQSFPGFLVTGNLYRPMGQGPFPGVLCPHGHWSNGRFLQVTDEAVQAELESGAETFAANARSPLQARCVNLARMGCVVFHYDMVGYADCQQISQSLAHGFRTQRPDMNGVDAWGFFSPRAESRLQSIMGLQTWNSIRSLDFLCGLPDVDPARIGLTGASGGGTQTFILAALDPRPTVAFPAVMVSTAMQGGCTCENCSLLRIETGNVEIAALFAPRPLGLSAANDWTHEMETKGFPELKQIYQLYRSAGLDVPEPELTANLQFGHNFNQPSREAMYRLFHREFGLSEPPEEREIEVLSPEELTVFDETHPRPEWDADRERELLRTWERLSRPVDWKSPRLTADAVAAGRVLTREGLEAIVGHPPSELEWVPGNSPNVAPPATRLRGGRLKARDVGLDSRMNVSVSGPENLLDASVKEVRLRLWMPESLPEGVDEGALPVGTVIADLELSRFGQHPGEVVNRLVNNGREAAGYTFGYNRSVLAWRVSQVHYALDYLANQFPAAKLEVQAGAESTPVAVVAFATADPQRVVRLSCQLQQFRFAEVDALQDPNFLPGSVKYGDVLGMLTLRPTAQIELGPGESELADDLNRIRQIGGGAGQVMSTDVPN